LLVTLDTTDLLELALRVLDVLEIIDDVPEVFNNADSGISINYMMLSSLSLNSSTFISEQLTPDYLLVSI